MNGDRYGSNFILLHVDIQLCQSHLINMFSFSILYFLLSCQKSGCLYVCGLISRSLIRFHWSSCLFLRQYQAVFSTVPHFFYWIICFLDDQFHEFFAYFGDQTSVCWGVGKDLFTFCRLLFCLADHVISFTEAFQF